MFGHQDEPVQQTNVPADQQASNSADNSYAAGAVNPALPPADLIFGPPPASAPVTDPNMLLEQQAAEGYTTAPVAPTDPTTQSMPTEPAPAPDVPVQTPVQLTVGTSSPLNNLKQQALLQLSPLVGHLDQTPEEKFRTTMMMIQASDNQSLLQTAYDAANQIEDEKARAQALLDVINEINYFSQQA
ncbi:hypothetical protein H7097_04605 [Aeromicrobium sp.]|nr:hypothetical protein [Candidatus Saccharibacteria bacterium]